jgi:pectate lyase
MLTDYTSISLIRDDGEDRTGLDSASVNWPYHTWKTVRIEAIGSSIKVYFENVLVMEAVDSTFSTGTIAFGETDALQVFVDNVTVRAPAN